MKKCILLTFLLLLINNGDGRLGINDVSNLISQLMADGEQPAYCDLNGDGKVTIADVSALIDMQLNAE